MKNTVSEAQALANLIQEEVWVLSNGEMVAARSDLAKEGINGGCHVRIIAWPNSGAIERTE